MHKAKVQPFALETFFLAVNNTKNINHAGG